MKRLRRILAITLGLIGTGAVVGAIAGGFALAFCMMITEPIGLEMVLGGFAFGGYLGAPLGAITAPLLAWLLLRRVPLGQAFLGSAAGNHDRWRGGVDHDDIRQSAGQRFDERFHRLSRSRDHPALSRA